MDFIQKKIVMSNSQDQLSSINEQENLTSVPGRVFIVGGTNTQLNTLTTEEESEFNNQLDNIFIELHKSDERICEDREETLRLATETRNILADLRNQFG